MGAGGYPERGGGGEQTDYTEVRAWALPEHTERCMVGF